MKQGFPVAANGGGKNESIIDRCKPDKIQLFMEYYDFEKIEEEPEIKPPNFYMTDVNRADNGYRAPNQSLYVPLSTLITQFTLNFAKLDELGDKSLVPLEIYFLPKTHKDV